MNPPVTDTGATEYLANLSIGAVVLIALGLTILRLILLRMHPAEPARAQQGGSIYRAIAEICESLIIAGVLVFLIIRPFFVQAFFIPSESMENTLMGHDAYDPTTGTVRRSTIHDHIFVNKLVYRYSNPHRGDIVVFRAPKSADSEDTRNGLPAKENVLIKRCIGIPGDTIEVETLKGSDGALHDYVIRNGEQLREYHKELSEWEAGDSLTPKEQQEARQELDTYGYTTKERMDPSRDPFPYGSPPSAAEPGGTREAEAGPLKLGPGQYWVMGDNRNNSNDSRYWGPLTRDRFIGKAFVIFWPPSRIHVLH